MAIPRRATFLLAAAALAAASAAASPPDCTGISAVFNQSSDFVGELTAVPIATGLNEPLLVTVAPGDLDRLFIVEQVGRIRIVKNGTLLATPFLDITGPVNFYGEQGLLGLAFHPDYQTNGWFFVYYTNNAGDNQVSRYKVTANPDVAAPQSAKTVITLAHPVQEDHNGGMIAFSPLDGRLYIGTGDGGGGCDTGPDDGNAQSLNSNLGKILRLDVDTVPYRTNGNPFNGATPGNDEIWALGLRNPWRWSFDRITGAIYIGDVGQNFWEEIDCSPGTSTGSENYGWKFCEGDYCNPNPSCGDFGFAPPGYEAPIREYDQDGTPCAVTGGYVYRGCRMGDLDGTYFYADFCDGFISTFRTDGACSASGAISREADLEPGGKITIDGIASFGEDNRGELYMLDYFNGEVFKILPEISIMEVSGRKAPPLLVNAAGNFAWEELEPHLNYVASYKMYRSIDQAAGPFTCVHTGTTTSWEGGDPAVPATGRIFYYLVTGLTAGLVESTAGARSDGTLRTVDTESVCLP